jgi:hypothetical protein
MADQPTTTTAPAFVRNISDRENPIIRVSDTPDDYISIDGVLYLEEQPAEGEEADWQQLTEKYLRKDSEKTLVWLGFNHQSNSGDFPDALAYRLQGEPGEYSKAEILSHINSWDASFSGYSFWDGHNWAFQHTSDEQGEWFPVELALEEVASHQGGWTHTALYLGTAGEDVDYYLGSSHAGGERLRMVSLEELAEGPDFRSTVKELIYAAADALMGRRTDEPEQRNLFAERCTLAQFVNLLNTFSSEDVSEESLRADFAANGTLL